ncbi:histidine phosphatase family protein [Pseudomonas frederiksbergensis]|uniref:histidine phosphatase family protein n=1 Tax=Pseudomonas frederiksbergensis TaxID=104087 RepID=UPI003CFBEDE2
MRRQICHTFIAGVGLLCALAFSCATFAKSIVGDLGDMGGWESLEFLQDWKNGDIAVLIRHEERCDRSSKPCLGHVDGITVAGSERAKKVGEKIKMHFGLEDVDVFTSPTIRTVQTAAYMVGDAMPLPSRHTICGKDVIHRLANYKKMGRSLMLVTHSACINNLIDASDYRIGSTPEYGSMLFVKFITQSKVEVLGKMELE